MSRYTGPACKKCQKLSQKMYLKGSRCYTNCPVDRQQSDKHFAANGPRGKMSDYGKHLREKQIARFSAGMSEAQFHRFFVKADNICNAPQFQHFPILEIQEMRRYRFPFLRIQCSFLRFR